MVPSKYIVYIIRSDQGYTYIGQTKNIADRLNRHNTNRSTSTKNKGRWGLVISYACNTRSEAMKLERKLKNLKSSEEAIKYLERLRGM